jgi:hypothetical protein
MLMQISFEFLIYIIISVSLLSIILFTSNIMQNYTSKNINTIEYALNGTINSIS